MPPDDMPPDGTNNDFGPGWPPARPSPVPAGWNADVSPLRAASSSIVSRGALRDGLFDGLRGLGLTFEVSQ